MGKRKLTVYRASTKDYVSVPKLTIQGQWLESLGFSIGDKLIAKCEQQGRHTIEKSEIETENIEIGTVAKIAVKYKGGGQQQYEES